MIRLSNLLPCRPSRFARSARRQDANLPHPETYAEHFLTQKRRMERVFNPLAIAQQIEKLCAARMMAAHEAGMTRLNDHSMRWSKGDRFAFHSFTMNRKTFQIDMRCATRRMFFGSNSFATLLLRIQLAILGQDRFCARFADKVCADIARDEARQSHKAKLPPTQALAAYEERMDLGLALAPPSKKADASAGRL